MMQGKVLMKTCWLEGKVDVENVSLFKSQREYTCLYLQGIPDSKIIIPPPFPPRAAGQGSNEELFDEGLGGC